MNLLSFRDFGSYFELFTLYFTELPWEMECFILQETAIQH